SHAVKDTVTRMGGTAVMNRVGHAFIKARMREVDGIFAGEVTGHYYFKDFAYADNGFIPALLMLELMSVKGQSLSELLAPYRERYFISGEINTALGSMEEVPARLDAIERSYADAQISKMDGVSIEYPDWHFNVRPSNTEPLLRLNLEAATPAEMERRRDEVIGIIRS
ncbi:MAG: phosphomannomutase/phosphoglucomutase, partial [Vicinamibacterales bacterium]